MSVSIDSDRDQETSPLIVSPSPIIGNIPIESTLNNGDEFSSTQSSAATTDEVSTAQLLGIMSSTYLGIVLAALDGTMVATLTASISASYNSLTLLAWLAASYFIANAVLQPLAGKLTDIYGRRAGLLLSHGFFCAGNLICGFAQGESMIIMGRVFAGLGSGGLNGIPLFIASDLVPLRRRGIWQGLNNIWFGLGSGLGGVFGGWMNDTLGWRWAFILLVPLTVISAILVAAFVRLPDKDLDQAESDEKWKRIDFLGAVVLTSATVILLVGLNAGGNVVPWFHPLILCTLPLSLALFLVFIYIENSYAVEPIIPVRLLLNKTIISACLTNWFFTMSQISLTFYAPIYFQVQGMSAMDAGVRLIPTSIGAALGGISTGAVMRALGRYYKLNIAIQCFFLLPLGLTTRFSLDTPRWYPFIYFFFTGFAYAGMLTITVTALIASVDQKDHAVITSGSFAFRGTGSTIGITICSLVFQNILITRLWESFGAEKDAKEIIRRLRDSLSEIKYLPHDWSDIAKDDYMAALKGVFLTIFGLAAMGTISSLFMKEHTLHKDMARRRS